MPGIRRSGWGCVEDGCKGERGHDRRHICTRLVSYGEDAWTGRPSFEKPISKPSFQWPRPQQRYHHQSGRGGPKAPAAMPGHAEPRGQGQVQANDVASGVAPAGAAPARAAPAGAPAGSAMAQCAAAEARRAADALALANGLALGDDLASVWEMASAAIGSEGLHGLAVEVHLGGVFGYTSLQPSIQRLAAGGVRYVHYAPPRNTFRMKQRPKLRSREFPDGLPELTGEALEQVALASAMSASMARLLRMHCQTGVSWTCAHPAASLLWQTKNFKRLFALYKVDKITMDMCCFGTASHKRTVIMTWDAQGDGLLGALNQRCHCRSHRHWTYQEKRRRGHNGPATIAYPRDLCTNHLGPCGAAPPLHLHGIGGCSGLSSCAGVGRCQLQPIRGLSSLRLRNRRPVLGMPQQQQLL